MSDALLIVDMQNAWINSNKVLYPSTPKAIENIQRLRNHFERRGFPIFHVMINHQSDGSDGRAGEKVFNVAGTMEAEIIDELKPRASEFLVPKTRLSSFFGTNLLKDLRGKGVTGVAITGLELRACVMATYMDAYQYDFRPVAIISDAVLDGNERYVKNFLETFKGEDFLMTTAEWIQS